MSNPRPMDPGGPKKPQTGRDAPEPDADGIVWVGVTEVAHETRCFDCGHVAIVTTGSTEGACLACLSTNIQQTPVYSHE